MIVECPHCEHAVEMDDEVDGAPCEDCGSHNGGWCPCEECGCMEIIDFVMQDVKILAESEV
jgi:primosomal protein N'